MGWLLDALNRWDRVLHSPGEIVPASKLVTLQDTLRNTQLGLVHDLYARTAVSSNSGGVVHGLHPTADGAVARRLNIAAGSAFAIPQALGVIDTVDPVVLDFTGASQVLDVGDGVNPRWDLISVRAIQTDVDVQAKLVKQADGSYVVTNLAQRQDVGCEVVYHAGTPAGAPVVDPLPSNEVAIAVIYVPAGWNALIGAGGSALYDVRTWLSARLGGVSEYIGMAEAAAGGGANPFDAIYEAFTDQTIKIAQNTIPASNLYRSAVGEAVVGLDVPRELNVIAVAPTASTGIGNARHIQASVSAPTPVAGGAINRYAVTLKHFSTAAGAPVEWDAGEDIAVRVALIKG